MLRKQLNLDFSQRIRPASAAVAASVTAAGTDVSGATTGGAVAGGAVCLVSGTLHASGAGNGLHRRTLDIGGGALHVGGALNIGSRTLHIGRALNVAGRLAVVVYRRSVVD